MALQSRSPPHSVSSQEEWDIRNKMSKTQSATSVSTSSSRQTINSSIQESSAKIYFVELEKYLTNILSKEASEGVSSQRTAARQKLSRLNNLQFHELATDVYDELIRRNLDNHKSFLPVRDDFHPRRNQARQKLATLPTTRFQDLASDVYHEIKRRYSHILMSEEELPPLPKPKHNDTKAHTTNIIPVKGMMNVESVDYLDDENNGQLPMTENGNTQSIDSLMADLGNMQNVSTDIEHLKYEYETKMLSMTKRIKMLELSLENATQLNNSGTRQSSSDKEQQLKIKQMQDEYTNLDNRYTQLAKEYNEQQLAVREVKAEIKQLIDELKNLSSKNEALRLQNEEANNEIRHLTQETKSWKRKYESASTELRSFKVQSINLDQQDLSKEFFLRPISKGAIGHQFVIEYQAAIDDLMKTSRSSKPSDVLLSMRTIVLACKAITTEVEDYEVNVGLTSPNQEILYDIKKKFSTELTNLLAATKNYAGGMGISPVSLVDAAAGNLTNTIVELVKLLGMRPAPDNENNTQSPSVITNETTPNSRMGKNNNSSTYALQNENNVMSLEKLSQFLKMETDHIVSSVQNLLNALRTNDSNLFEIITSIINIVANIIQTSRKTFLNGPGLEYKDQGNAILSDLEKCNGKIIHIRDTSFTQSPENANSIAKRNLAQESYEIAKYTKELINMLDL
ncbi:uncharacterized protein BX663DRAFT_499944 [Cokeromyces recurvatus]|uniref:uncharacterized protein n=1 Tax=Cokeromyces recurvatus TaxID=90255 RepID=UPI0022203E62|nr:uncharacterized protein BX663DRAFT_499944 [Cokeromyces recurvatus]KAI7905497.1 hypothetical protein BX663DRAFT_499944 [Cokeromyces recurvatus]